MECARSKHIAVSDLLSGRTDEIDGEVEDPDQPPLYIDSICKWVIV